MKQLHFILIGLGGAVGAVVRFGICDIVADHVLAVIICNIVGSFVLACANILSHKFYPELRSMVAAGFCGGISIFASFSQDSVEMLRSGEFVLFAINVIANFAICLLAVYAAYGIVRFFNEFFKLAAAEAREEEIRKKKS